MRSAPIGAAAVTCVQQFLEAFNKAGPRDYPARGSSDFDLSRSNNQFPDMRSGQMQHVAETRPSSHSSSGPSHFVRSSSDAFVGGGARRRSMTPHMIHPPKMQAAYAPFKHQQGAPVPIPVRAAVPHLTTTVVTPGQQTRHGIPVRPADSRQRSHSAQGYVVRTPLPHTAFGASRSEVRAMPLPVGYDFSYDFQPKSYY